MNKKRLYLAGIIVLILVLISAGTYALLLWSSEENTEMTLRIGDFADVIFSEGQDINVSNIGPVFDYEKDGEKTSFSIRSLTDDGVKINVNLNITTISDNLKNECFKYVLLYSDDDTNFKKVTEGSFADSTNNSVINLVEDYKLLDHITYKLIIYIDGNMNNSTTMQNGNLNGYISVEATQGSPSLMTLTNLGLVDLLNEETPTIFTATATEDEGIYAAEDDLGTSYYFRGASTRNYVKFGRNSSDQDMYWRIIRINGDGTVRMIYDGTQAHVNGTESTDRQVGTIAYNTQIGYGDTNGYVGYMYGSTLGSTYELEHSNDVNSTIKTYLEGNDTTDGWYKDNIIDTGYSSYVADAIYCNDRKIVTDSSKYNLLFNDDTVGSGVGYGNEDSNTLYGIWGRITIGINQARMSNMEDSYGSVAPTLKCFRINDRFTQTDSTIITSDGLGTNKKLRYPVALITADEVLFAGGYNISNFDYYLYTGSNYYTMTPSSFEYDEVAFAFLIDESGYLSSSYRVTSDLGVKPVISLKADVLKYDAATSNGSMEHPFVVSL